HLSKAVPTSLKAKFVSRPAAIVIFPTKYLEMEKEKEFAELGLTAVAINSDTLPAARLRGSDLWQVARNADAILLSPEQLISPGFYSLLLDTAFVDRVMILAIDEIHLLDKWGSGFRKAFLQIGYMRARLPSRTILIAVTATLLAGERSHTVCRLLGLRSGEYHTIRRSNMRYDIQLVFRVLSTGLGGTAFPDLKWVLDAEHVTLIHCATISLGFRVLAYLWQLSPDKLNLSKRIRLYNSLNFSSFNSETQQLVRMEDCEVQIIIATDTLIVGANIMNIYTVIIVGESDDPDSVFQWFGRANRNLTFSSARGIMYVTQKAHEKARAVIDSAPTRSKSTKEPAKVMHRGMAQLLLAPCLREEQNHLYNNPMEDIQCSCSTCSTNPPPSKPASCNCSGCIDENTPASALPLQFIFEDGLATEPSKLKRLNAAEITISTKRLVEFRWSIWKAADRVKFDHIPPTAYMPDIVIKNLLHQFTVIRSSSDILPFVQSVPRFSTAHVNTLWTIVLELRTQFMELEEEKRRAKAAEGCGDAQSSADNLSEADRARKRCHISESDLNTISSDTPVHGRSVLYSSMRLNDLQQLCRERKLKISGKKGEVIFRLQEDDKHHEKVGKLTILQRHMT
ncbi:hypothetical protein EW146_g9951, partial [Bondarzewia mesenterica]